MGDPESRSSEEDKGALAAVAAAIPRTRWDILATI